jgi:hypothetical protein
MNFVSCGVEKRSMKAVKLCDPHVRLKKYVPTRLSPPSASWNWPAMFSAGC